MKLATLYKNCKMTMYVPTFAKHVDEEDQHGGGGGAYFKSQSLNPAMEDHTMKRVALGKMLGNNNNIWKHIEGH